MLSIAFGSSFMELDGVDEFAFNSTKAQHETLWITIRGGLTDIEFYLLCPDEFVTITETVSQCCCRWHC